VATRTSVPALDVALTWLFPIRLCPRFDRSYVAMESLFILTKDYITSDRIPTVLHSYFSTLFLCANLIYKHLTSYLVDELIAQIYIDKIPSMLFAFLSLSVYMRACVPACVRAYTFISNNSFASNFFFYYK
jgi:hypothetical protein